MQTEEDQGSQEELPSPPDHGVGMRRAVHRGLSKEHLGGVVFGCTDNNIEECFSLRLFGSSAAHASSVRNITVGLPLFLFKYDDKMLHGIFKAASAGGWNLNPYAWTKDGRGRKFPAQVRVAVHEYYRPLPEFKYLRVLQGDFIDSKRLFLELSKAQAQALCKIFRSWPRMPNIEPASFGRYCRELMQTMELEGICSRMQVEPDVPFIEPCSTEDGADESCCEEIAREEEVDDFPHEQMPTTNEQECLEIRCITGFSSKQDNMQVYAEENKSQSDESIENWTPTSVEENGDFRRILQKLRRIDSDLSKRAVEKEKAVERSELNDELNSLEQFRSHRAALRAVDTMLAKTVKKTVSICDEAFKQAQQDMRELTGQLEILSPKCSQIDNLRAAGAALLESLPQMASEVISLQFDVLEFKSELPTLGGY